MKRLSLFTAVGLAILHAASPSAATAEIVRHKKPHAGAITLDGVTLPANAEILVLSGQLADPMDPSKPPSGYASYGDTRIQTISVLNKIKGLLEARGYGMKDVVKLTVFLTADPTNPDRVMDFKGMNEGFRTFFGTESNPNTVARSALQVARLAGPYFLVEIEATAARAAGEPAANGRR